MCNACEELLDPVLLACALLRFQVLSRQLPLPYAGGCKARRARIRQVKKLDELKRLMAANSAQSQFSMQAPGSELADALGTASINFGLQRSPSFEQLQAAGQQGMRRTLSAGELDEAQLSMQPLAPAELVQERQQLSLLLQHVVTGPTQAPGLRAVQHALTDSQQLSVISLPAGAYLSTQLVDVHGMSAPCGLPSVQLSGVLIPGGTQAGTRMVALLPCQAAAYLQQGMEGGQAPTSAAIRLPHSHATTVCHPMLSMPTATTPFALPHTAVLPPHLGTVIPHGPPAAVADPDELDFENIFRY